MEASVEGLISERVIARLNKLRDDIRASIGAHGLRASGRTQESLRVTHEGDEYTLWGRAFFPALQYGSSGWSGKTGIRCTFEEFKAIIRDWVRDKGINIKGQSSQYERAIGAIAHTIMTSGTKQYRNHAYTDVYDTLIEEAMADIEEIPTGLLSLEVDNIVGEWTRG